MLGASGDKFNLKPFTEGSPHLKALVNNTWLPEQALYPAAGVDKGIELDTLRDLLTEWVTTFDWGKQEDELNQLDHFTAEIEGQVVHFVHQKSKASDTIPVILLHGWPGSFQEFLPVIEPLTQPLFNATSGKNVSFDVMVPSLPGFVFSSPPPQNSTGDDTARIFNTLMSEVLGYSTYAVHGTDGGSGVAYSLYSSFNETVCAAAAAHFAFLPFTPPTAQDIADNNITLLDAQKVTLQRNAEWNTIGTGYFTEQTTKPNDIGLALYDNPIGQLAWIGGKFQLWSDPRAGTPPSVLDNTAILTSVSLYYLTHSFLSSVWIYPQNPNGFHTVYTPTPTDAPLLFSQYEFNVGFWPEEYVTKVGNLVSYKGNWFDETDVEPLVHDFGGHFAGLDNPPALIEDIRDVAPGLLPEIVEKGSRMRRRISHPCFGSFPTYTYPCS
ncbi:Alpha/Beta hydrolase protein [Roridomyces roridus]|uniref:Alpha/Beta hydrolase protein n=1 Tax=Roridomyces roridus TaxID=1738132 RepID=A0AAD7BE42_9AGAR|nr:Alpha/Beta hydrolase protein [Roridomyces roridus]